MILSQSCFPFIISSLPETYTFFIKRLMNAFKIFVGHNNPKLTLHYIVKSHGALFLLCLSFSAGRYGRQRKVVPLALSTHRSTTACLPNHHTVVIKENACCECENVKENIR